MRSIEVRHERHTRISYPEGDRIQIPFEDCPACLHQQRICKSKRRFEGYEDAHAHARERNILNGWGLMLCPYQCVWCEGWHITRARKNYGGKARWTKVEKERRRWLFAQEVERRGREQG